MRISRKKLQKLQKLGALVGEVKAAMRTMSFELDWQRLQKARIEAFIAAAKSARKNGEITACYKALQRELHWLRPTSAQS